MITEILSKYENFYDSIITDIHVNNNFNLGEIIIKIEIRCMNALNNYCFENVLFTLENVSYFNIFNSKKLDYFFPNGAVFKKQDDLYIIDFDPLVFSDYLLYNENSNFIIKCDKLSYKIID